MSNGINTVAGLTATGDEKSCGLTVAAVSDADLGLWTCNLNEGLLESQGVQFSRGTFALLAEGHQTEGMRLPRWEETISYTAVQFVEKQKKNADSSPPFTCFHICETLTVFSSPNCFSNISGQS